MCNTGKTKIIDAARTIISEHGIQGATIRGIAEEAGVSTGAIYHYYSSKEAILYDVMDDGLSEMKRISTISTEQKKKFETLIQEIFDSMQERFQKDAESRLQFYLAHEAILGNEELKHKFKDKYKDWIDRLEIIFVQAYHIEPGPLTKAVAAWTLAGIDGMVLQILLETNTVNLTHINQILDYLLNEGFTHFFQIIGNE
ncbi:TetR/AcrR family transcriptional regulator [Ornithinibacillus gellani]|uniref:TetR/AcrR family transcriptional regulator n=1 Tax=Ornithinibacillus gellani TaxID=2293253 RepID=UPI000F49EFB1|nr:TetR/AcrR family transcriptional regulator [Ornithinibacillus gellani]TQS76330.1 TetR/AcrR family transcriptional regulator [Ornithinibacillus gellani]